MRESLIVELMAILKQKQFTVSSFLHTNSCFDIAAKKDNVAFVFKVLSNIDGFREEQALELEKVAALFNAHPFIIGEKTKVFALDSSFVYERHGITAITLESFSEILEKHFPSVRYFKGKKIVDLHSEELKLRRREKGISLEDLAHKVDVSPESLHRYEKGNATTLDVARKLEEILGQGLMKPVDLFSRPSIDKKKLFTKHAHDPHFEWLEDLGIQFAEFKHAPFKVFSEKKEEVIISRADTKEEVKKNAIRLVKTKKVFSQHAFILAKDFEKKSVQDIPVIEQDELSTFDKFDDLIRTVKKREQH
jgi:putative transcriptional regulator